jgi:hypothetical protein
MRIVFPQGGAAFGDGARAGMHERRLVRRATTATLTPTRGPRVLKGTSCIGLDVVGS